MTIARIKTQQAHDFALAIVSDITAYINSHRAEYLLYLAKTGQVDPKYECGSVTVEHKGDKMYE